MTDLRKLLFEDFSKKITILTKIAKRETYAMLYGTDVPMQDRIDEEGCGVVFAAAKYPWRKPQD